MSRFHLARLAETDLAEIHAFIARDKPAAAQRQLSAFFERFHMLAKQPILGEARDDLSVGLRTFALRGYVICYCPTGNSVRIARVLHGSRDLAALLRPTKP